MMCSCWKNLRCTVLYSDILHTKEQTKKVIRKFLETLQGMKCLFSKKKDDKKYIIIYKVNTHNTHIQKKMKNM